MSDPYGTEPMFSIPEKYRPPARKVKYPQWRKYSGKRTSCDECILALARGDVKFMAEPAMKVRTDEDGQRFLCSVHAAIEYSEDERKRLL